jgi:hypothetical protein
MDRARASYGLLVPSPLMYSIPYSRLPLWPARRSRSRSRYSYMTWVLYRMLLYDPYVIRAPGLPTWVPCIPLGAEDDRVYLALVGDTRAHVRCLWFFLSDCPRIYSLWGSFCVVLISRLTRPAFARPLSGTVRFGHSTHTRWFRLDCYKMKTPYLSKNKCVQIQIP